MIESVVRVTAVERGYAWVIADEEASGGCSSCSASGSCGGGLLSKLKSRRDAVPLRTSIDDGLNPEVGDKAVMGLEEGVYLRGMLRIYLFPLLIMLLIAGAVEIAFSKEWLTVTAGLLGLAAAMAYSRYISRYSKRHSVTLPRLIKVLPHLAEQGIPIKLAV